MDRQKRDAKTTFILKRREGLSPLKKKAEEAQTFFETVCESITPTRHMSIVALLDRREPQYRVLKEAFTEIDLTMCWVGGEFDLCEEIGLNNVVGVVLDLARVTNHESIISFLKKRGVAVYVVVGDSMPEKDLWYKEFENIYSWPGELGRLTMDVKAAQG